MTKSKLYKLDRTTSSVKRNNKQDGISFVVGIIVYAFVLMLVSNLFENFYISSFWYAVIAALILSALNYTIKPILIYWTLPLSILTFGIAYPIVNMINLKLCDIIMGKSFEIHGFISMFFIAIFISILKIILDSLITKNV